MDTGIIKFGLSCEPKFWVSPFGVKFDVAVSADDLDKTNLLYYVVAAEVSGFSAARGLMTKGDSRKGS